MTSNYHHKNLKETLLEKGVTLLNEVGEQQFSLRKLAAYCGVSHMAPYAHYKNKEEFLATLKLYVIEQFMAALENTKKEYKSSQNLLLQLGITYITFFLEHANYYDFLFLTQSSQEFLYTLQEFEPYQLFYTTAIEEFQKLYIPEDKWEQNILMMWSLVHGLSYSYLHTNLYKENWKESAYDILSHAFF